MYLKEIICALLLSSGRLSKNVLLFVYLTQEIIAEKAGAFG